ncbi:uncharacterized protein LOC128546652 [Mercenaria mercenaria]|uniref:uncharacterized protein LOC128546652 n=1 Tax=Mercenaria mercenaria TaxID=6596 RepID=UPI00234EF99A|nr:uncharacterized protein LOC128546652 [Mercenaria mercenaria]
MADKFFGKDSPHGLVKRIMYKKYLQAFIPITQQAKDAYGQQLYTTAIIDGFAGAGRYGDEWPAEIERYGSPLIALMVSLNYLYRKQHGKDKIWRIQSSERDSDAEIVDMVATMSLSENAQKPTVKPKIKLIFIEKDAAHFKGLKDNIAEVLDYFFPNPDVSYTESETEDGIYHFIITSPNYPISCKLVNTELTNFKPPWFIKDHLVMCLVFLDPFGVSQTPITHVQKFVGPGNSLLINFMSSFVNRFVKTRHIENLYGIPYLYEKASEMKIQLEYESLSKYISYLVRQFESGSIVQPLNEIQCCAANYEKMLKNVFGTESLLFEMRGRNNNIIYHLIFVTDHIKGVEIMKEAMNCCSQNEGEMTMSDYQFYRNGCVLNLGNTQDVTVVANTIYEKFAGCSKINVLHVKNYVLLDTPYVFRKKSLAVMEKEQTPRLENVVDQKGQPPKRKGTYPDDRTWYLTFSWTEEIDYFAVKIYKKYGPNQVVALHDIKEDFPYDHFIADVLRKQYRCIENTLTPRMVHVTTNQGKKKIYMDQFVENALLMMATDSSPECSIYYKDDGCVPEQSYVFSRDREWYIVFRRTPVFDRRSIPDYIHVSQLYKQVCF